VPILSVEFRAQQNSAGVLAADGPRVPVEIRVPAKLEQLLGEQGQAIPQALNGLGLIDTGATISMIDAEVTQRLGLSPVGTASLATPGGQTTCAVYPVRIAIVVQPRPPLVAAEFASTSRQN